MKHTLTTIKNTFISIFVCSLLFFFSVAKSQEKVASEDFSAYLVAHQSLLQQDFNTAAKLFLQLAQKYPDHLEINSEAIYNLATVGKIKMAHKLAKAFTQNYPQHVPPSMQIISKILDAVVDNKMPDENNTDNIPQYGSFLLSITHSIITAWQYAQQNNMLAARQTIDKISPAFFSFLFNESANFYRIYQQALLLHIQQKYFSSWQIAYALLQKTNVVNKDYSMLYRLLSANYLKNNKLQSALSNWSPLVESFPSDMYFSQEYAYMQKHQKLRHAVDNPTEAMANSLLYLNLLVNPNSRFGIINMQIAHYISPDNHLVTFALAQAQHSMTLFQDSIDTISLIKPNSTVYPEAMVLKSKSFQSLQQPKQAKQTLEKLQKIVPAHPEPYYQLALLFQQNEEYPKAITQYNSAIKYVDVHNQKNWYYFYSRGIALERNKQFPLAEVDFLRSLKMSPDNPIVLNYLAYSWLDQDVNIELAFDLLHKSYEQRPDDGAITDSLGWAHFKLGQYKQAVKYLEQAVQLLPTDPVVNEHLGDVYWKLDLQRDARFHWKAALNFNKDFNDLKRLNLKYVNGIK